MLSLKHLIDEARMHQRGYLHLKCLLDIAEYILCWDDYSKEELDEARDILEADELGYLLFLSHSEFEKERDRLLSLWWKTL